MDCFSKNLRLAKDYKIRAENSLPANPAHAKKMIMELGQICKNVDYYLLLLRCVQAEDDKGLVLDTLKEALEKFPFNLSLNIALCDFFVVMGDYESCFTRCCEISLMWPPGNEVRTGILGKACEVLENIALLAFKANKEKYKDMIKKLRDASDEGNVSMNYPLLNESKLAIDQFFNEGTEHEYFVNLCDTILLKKYSLDMLSLYRKVETLKGEKTDGSYHYQLASPSVVPFSYVGLEHDYNLQLKINNKEYDFGSASLDANRFYYFRLPADTSLTLMHQPGDFFVGRPITLQSKPGLRKLVLCLFVESLSYKFLEDIGFERNMPNTYRYFETGFISDNCFAGSEWSLSGTQTVLTGKYTTGHKKFYPQRVYDYSRFSKHMPEYFSEKGYFTTCIAHDYHMSPDSGMHKGFDRMIFKRHSDYRDFEIVKDVIESAEAFEETNQFIFAGLPDLSDAVYMTFFDPCASVAVDLKTRLNVSWNNATPVYQDYDPCRMEIYKMRLKKLDVTLGILFEYLAKKYKNDEITVLMTSDSGQAFISKEKPVSPNARGQVPLFIKDAAADSSRSDEIICLTDILPIFGRLCDFDVDTDIDGRLPKALGGDIPREFSYTESIVPGWRYQAALSNATHYLLFESEGCVNGECMFLPGNFTYAYKNRLTEKDETEMYPEHVAFLLDAVFEHIGDYILL